MRGGIEARTRRIAAWDFAAAACALMALAVMTISSSFYALLPLILLSAVIRQRLPGGGPVELVLSAAALGAGILLAGEAGVRNASGLLASIAAEVLLGGLFLLIARLYLDHPRGGNLLTLSIGLAAMTAGGSGNLGWAYPALCALYLLTALHGLRAREHARTQPRFPPLARLVPGIAYLVGSAAFAGALIVALPPLYGFATERFVDWIRIDPPKTGFTEGGMFLGAMEGMWESDEIVMRIDGAAFNLHLRGSVHRRYRGGAWLQEPAPPRAPRTAPVAGSAPPVSLFRVSRESAVLMTTLGAMATTAAGIPLRTDVFGIARSSDPLLTRYRLVPSPQADRPLPPEMADLDVPEELRATVGGMAAAWTRRAADPAGRMAAILRRLEGDFVYSQHYRRTPGADPVLEFLQQNRQGHCEYFASALALLARAQGIPARVVRGYRVRERNPITGQYIVRESNAHAWVEAHIDGEWRTYDPAPLQSLEPPPRESMSWLAALADALRVASQRAWQVARANLKTTGYAIAALLAALYLWGRFRTLLRMRARTRNRPAGQNAFVRPPEVETLFAELSRRGLVRATGETLEQFGERCAQAGLPAPFSVAHRQIAAYATKRYRGHS